MLNLGHPNMFDWGNAENIYAREITSVLAGTQETIIEDTGAGYIYHLSISTITTALSSPDFIIEIDGVQKFVDAEEIASNFGNRFYQPIYFKNSFRVIVVNNSGSSLSVATFISYHKLGNINENANSLFEATEIKNHVASTQSGVLETALNVSGSGFLISLDANTFGTVVRAGFIRLVIDGVEIHGGVLYSGNGTGTSGSNRNQVSIKKRFNTSLLVEHRLSSATTSATHFTRINYTLD